jgi:dipeptidyl aminopeptidase/acylaminoacyl peptidase
MTASPSTERGSPFTPAGVASGVERSEVTITADGVYWLEHRFDEGHSRVMGRAASGDVSRPVTPDGVDVGTLAWEYGGGSYLVTGDQVVYSDRADQRLYRVRPGAAAVAITPAASSPLGERFADGCAAPDGRWAVYVRESHIPGAPVEHELVVVGLDGLAEPRILTRGQDFYAAPRLSPDGRRLAWTAWSKPRMPWDGTELWLADVGADLTLGNSRLIAGGATESVLQPSFAPDGTLHWVSDESGWWNLYALGDGGARPLCPERAEFAVPPWTHGRRSYGFLADGTIAAVQIRDAVHELVRIDPATGGVGPLAPDLTWIADGHLCCHGATVALAAATPAGDVAVLGIDAAGGTRTVVAADPPEWDADQIAVPSAIRFPDSNGEQLHGFWYRPLVGREARTPPGLILHLHGGPTDAARLALDAELQLWTSRGFAVLDLNYSGSTGFGSAYRRRLDGAWGERDLADCTAAVAHLVAERMVDPTRVFVRGASAGGYLTLRCLTAASSTFRAGMARCAIADLALWREDAHDFESRYTDMLVGAPVQVEAYRRRSPVRGVGSGAAPLLLIHGLADRVVPPEHSERMATAYRAAGRPQRLELLEGEPHGLRRADSRRRWLEAELGFVAGIGGQA